MNRYILLPYLVASGLLAFAQPTSAETFSTQQEIEALKGRLHALEARQEKKAAITFAPGPKITSADGRTSLQLDGFVQADASFYTQDDVGRADSTTIRRARIGVKGTIEEAWNYRLLLEFGDVNATLVDAFIAYKGLENTTLTVGQFREPFSLEQLTPAKYWTFTEKAAAKALSPTRSIGVAGSYAGDNWTATAGLFGENVNSKRSVNEGWALTGRTTYVPWYAKNEVLHLGLAATHRQIGGDQTFKLKAPDENGITSVKSLDLSAFADADDTTAYGAEVLGIYGPYSVQAEYIRRDITLAGGDVSLNGWYVQGSWFLTGESRNYKRKKGAIGRTKILNPLTPEMDGLGAFELAARYSELDLNDGSVARGKLENITTGLNWYPNDYTKLMLDYGITTTDEHAKLPDDEAQVVMVRAQFEF